MCHGKSAKYILNNPQNLILVAALSEERVVRRGRQEEKGKDTLLLTKQSLKTTLEMFNYHYLTLCLQIF